VREHHLRRRARAVVTHFESTLPPTGPQTQRGPIPCHGRGLGAPTRLRNWGFLKKRVRGQSVKEPSLVEPAPVYSCGAELSAQAHEP
jgi:hypothetical protein